MRTPASRGERLGLALLWLAGWGAVLPGSVSAQSRLSSSIDTTLITVGDRINMEVRVAHPTGSSVVWPDSLSLSPLEILDAQALPPTSGDGGLYSTLRIAMTAFELGELEIPSFDVRVQGADGTVDTLETDRFGIEVVTVGQDETGDIRDIRGPLWISVGLVQVAFWLLLLGLAIVAAIWWFRHRRTGDGVDGVEPGPPPRPAHEVALEALSALEASPMLERGQVKEYHIEVSDILRRYVEGQFHVHALEMTTWEVLAGLEDVGVSVAVREDFRRFLDQCDMVKFAKVRPGRDGSQQALTLGRSIVETTMDWRPPEPEPAPVLAIESEIETESETEPDIDTSAGEGPELQPTSEAEAS